MTARRDKLPNNELHNCSYSESLSGTISFEYFPFERPAYFERYFLYSCHEQTPYQQLYTHLYIIGPIYTVPTDLIISLVIMLYRPTNHNSTMHFIFGYSRNKSNMGGA